MRTASPPDDAAPVIRESSNVGVRAGDRVFRGLAAGAGIAVLVIMGAIGDGAVGVGADVRAALGGSVGTGVVFLSRGPVYGGVVFGAAFVDGGGVALAFAVAGCLPGAPAGRTAASRARALAAALSLSGLWLSLALAACAAVDDGP